MPFCCDFCTSRSDPCTNKNDFCIKILTQKDCDKPQYNRVSICLTDRRRNAYLLYIKKAHLLYLAVQVSSLQLFVLLHFSLCDGLQLDEVLLHHVLPDFNHIYQIKTVKNRTLLDVRQAYQLRIVFLCNIEHGLEQVP